MAHHRKIKQNEMSIITLQAYKIGSYFLGNHTRKNLWMKKKEGENINNRCRAW